MESNSKITFVVLALLTLSCTEKHNPINPVQEGYEYTVPNQTDDGWVTTSLTDVGMIEQPIVDMVNFIENSSNHQIHNILIIKDKKLVFEKYFSALDYSISPPALGSTFISYNMDMLHWLASGSKSVTSVLFGIAIDKGFINSDVNKNIITYFPQYSSILTGGKENITVKHLLTMSSGLDWDESTYPFGDPRNDVTQLFQQSDPVRFVLAKNLLTQPGTMFHYNSGVTNVLAQIIYSKSGKNLLQFATEYLFQPLGIEQYEWQRLSGNYYFASGGLSLRPRDMAKIGFLFLNGGKWNGIQILSQEWIDASMQNYINPNFGFADGYGYQWWLKTVQSGENEIKYLFAAGYGEQLMFVVPALDLIVIFNCGYFDVPISVSPYQLIDDYIVPALFNE